MSSKPVSDLDASDALDGTELFYADGKASAVAADVKVTSEQLRDFIGRTKLTGATTYYVRSDGSDSNTGLANTAGGAFLTLQHALDVVRTLDINNNDLTIRLGTGTFAGAATIGPFTGDNQNVTILGDVATPSNVVISSPIYAWSGADIAISGLKFVSSAEGFIAAYGGIVRQTGVCDFGACVLAHMMAIGPGSLIELNANYTISASSPAHWISLQQAEIFTLGGTTITLTGTPAFSTGFAYVFADGHVWVEPVTTFTGSATGKRFLIDNNGSMYVYGLGVTGLPGSIAGDLISGSYNSIGPREKLQAGSSRTYYVRTNGSSDNDGLANTAGGAFRDPQDAIEAVLRGLDFAGQNVTINIDGAHTTGIAIGFPWQGGGTLTLTGSSSASITVTGGSCIRTDAALGGVLLIGDGLTLSTVTSGDCINHNAAGEIVVTGSLTFGACAGSHVSLNLPGAFLEFAGASYAITGGAVRHYYINSPGAYLINLSAVTLTGSLGFTVFADCRYQGSIVDAGTFTGGTITGQRFRVEKGGVIDCGASSTHYPGNSSGTGTNFGASPWGLYI